MPLTVEVRVFDTGAEQPRQAMHEIVDKLDDIKWAAVRCAEYVKKRLEVEEYEQ